MSSKPLIFKKYTQNSALEFSQIYQSSEIMKYIGDGLIYSDQNCQQGLTKLIARYDNKNTGHWAVYYGEKYIGKALLLPWDNKKNFELGYAVLPNYWGKGYGSQMAKQMLNLAIKDGHKSLIATVHRKNKGSIKILKRLGFKYKKIVKKHGRRKDLYEWKHS